MIDDELGQINVRNVKESIENEKPPVGYVFGTMVTIDWIRIIETITAENSAL